MRSGRNSRDISTSPFWLRMKLRVSWADGGGTNKAEIIEARAKDRNRRGSFRPTRLFADDAVVGVAVDAGGPILAPPRLASGLAPATHSTVVHPRSRAPSRPPRPLPFHLEPGHALRPPVLVHERAAGSPDSAARHLVRRQHWTTARMYVPLSVPLYILTDAGGAKGERRVPISTTLVQNYFSTGRKVHILQEDITLSRTSLAQWIKGDALDPRGEVVVESGLPVFWLHVKAGLNDQEEAERLMGQGVKRDRVILWLVGGGYIGGSPVQGTRCFDAARETGLRVMGANYRKATRPEWAFPAALQDAIVAYAHLVELGYHEIVVAGDSAGAGASVAHEELS